MNKRKIKVFGQDQLIHSIMEHNHINSNISILHDNFVILQRNTDDFFKVILGIIVFLMQCGFAFLEAGAVRRKNTVNIIRLLQVNRLI